MYVELCVSADHKSCLRPDTVGDRLHPPVRQKNGVLSRDLKMAPLVRQKDRILAGDLNFSGRGLTSSQCGRKMRQPGFTYKLLAKLISGKPVLHRFAPVG